MRRLVAALAVLLGLGAAGEAAAYEVLSAEAIAAIEQCGASVTLRGRPSAAGEFYGALYAPSVEGEQVYSRGVAVVVGASVFQDEARFPRLPGVAKDVQAMSDLLISPSGADLGYDVLIKLVDEAVTGRNVACLVQNALPSFIDRDMDRLFFYWAGHGMDNGQGRGYLPFYDTPPGPLNDFSALPMLAIQDWSRRQDAMGGVRQAIFVIDACASGLATDASRSAERLKPLPNSRLVEDYRTFLADYAELGSRVHVVFTAADKQGPTRETPDGGYFTQEFVRSFGADGRVADDNGILSHHALAQHLLERMHDLGNPPRPQVKILSGTSENAFLLRPDAPLILRFSELRAAHLQALREQQETGGVASESAAGGATGAQQRDARGDVAAAGTMLRGADVLVDNCTGGDNAIQLDAMDYGDLRETRGMCRQVIKLNELNDARSAPPYLTDASLLMRIGRLLYDQQDTAKAGFYFTEAEKQFTEASRLNGGAEGASTGMLDLADLIYQGKWAAPEGGGDEKMVAMVRRAYELGNRNQGGHFYAWLKRDGRGTPVDLPGAVRLFEESLAAGNPSAGSQLGKIYASGNLGAPDYSRAKQFYVAAGDAGMVEGYLDAAQLYLDGHIAIEQASADAEAMRLVQRALEMQPDHGWALNFVGWMHEMGRGTASNPTLAADFYQRSLDAGFAYAGVNLGTLKRLGVGVPKDLEAAKTLFADGCNAGQARGCAILADMMIFGEGYQPSPELDAEALKAIDAALAADPNYGYALTLKGYLLENGRAVAQDVAAAAEAYRLAGQNGNTWGWRNLGYLMLRGKYDASGKEIWRPDPQAAAAAFGEGEARDDPDSMVALAGAMLAGQIGPATEESRAAAVAKLERAEALGSLWAVEELGRFYEGGYGGTPDLPQAVRAYKRAAARDSRYAADRLGTLLDNGTITRELAGAEQLARAWDYFAQCGDIGEKQCYYSAAYALFRRAEGRAPESAAMADAAARPQGQEAIDRIHGLLSGAAGASPDADIALAALNLASGSFKLPSGFVGSADSTEALLRPLADAGNSPQAVAGLALYGIMLGQPKVSFEALASVYSPEMSTCAFTGFMFPEVRTPFFPGFDCGWYDLGLPMWTFGMAETTTGVKLRAAPGDGEVIDTLKKGTRVIYLPLDNQVGNRWVKVQDEQDRIGWLNADYLRPIGQETAKAAAQ